MPEEEGIEEQLSVLAEELREPAAVLPVKVAMRGVPGSCVGRRAIG